MNITTIRSSTLERLLAAFLEYGTWVGSTVVAVGIVLGVCIPLGFTGLAGSHASMTTVSIGVAIFILLPILRLALMLGVYLHQRDYRFSFIVALVLLIVGMGCFAGVRLGPLAG